MRAWALGALLLFCGLASAEPVVVSMEVEATGYCPCRKCTGHNSPEVGGHGLTTAGTRPKAGVTLATDWTVIPRGSLVHVEGLGVRLASDKGSAIQGPRIDVFFERHSQARKFGRRRLRVLVLAEPPPVMSRDLVLEFVRGDGFLGS